MPPQLADPAVILQLSTDCALSLYASRPPSPAYANRVAALLFGTAAHESAGFHHTRQLGFADHTPSGGWSFWQIEWPSILDSLALLRRSPLLARNTAEFLGLIAYPRLMLPTPTPLPLLSLIRSWPRLAVSFARLHYMRFPEPIPADLAAQAAYWKRTYNTFAGGGTVAQYLASWAAWAAPALRTPTIPNPQGTPPQ